MITTRVDVLIVGADAHGNRMEIESIRQELKTTCPGWEIRFVVPPTFEGACGALLKYEQFEVVHFANDCDFDEGEWKNGGKLVAPAIAQYRRKLIVNFGWRLLESILRPIFTEYEIQTKAGLLQAAVQQRWEMRPAAKMRLVTLVG